MDDINLIEHIVGDKTVANKLRKTGFTTLQKVIKVKPALLAGKTGFSIELVGKIISSAKLLNRQARPTAITNSKTKAKAKTKTKSKKKIVGVVSTKKRVKALKSMIKKKGTKRIKKLIEKQQKTKKEDSALNTLNYIDSRILLGLAMKRPGIKEKILNEAKMRKDFRGKITDKLVRCLLDD